MQWAAAILDEIEVAYRETGLKPRDGQYRSWDYTCGCPMMVLAVYRSGTPITECMPLDIPAIVGCTRKEETAFESGYDLVVRCDSYREGTELGAIYDLGREARRRFPPEVA